MNRIKVMVGLGAAVVALALAPAVPAQAAATGIYQNCTALHTKYPHGVGRTTAHDHTSGKPVTTFKHSTTIYNQAMTHNRGLDADKDGIACEKA